MREYPILFSAPMVRALLADRKHVTRRLSKQWLKVKAGDRLWVREAFYVDLIPFDKGPLPKSEPRPGHPTFTIRDSIYFRADGTCCEQIPECCCGEVGPVRWRPSIHMPRWASRILLECEEDARVERLQDISDKDATLEGMEACTPADQFRVLWSTLHTKPGERVEDNPEVIRVGRFHTVSQERVNVSLPFRPGCG